MPGLPGLVSLPEDLSKYSLPSPSKLRLGDGGGKDTLPTEEGGRESHEILCDISDYEEQTWEWKDRATEVLRKAPILP